MHTEVIYICTTDRRNELLTSLDTLFNTGTTFDCVTVFVIGPIDKKWRFDDSRIRVRSVPSRFGDYMYGNKVYLCDSEADRVIFLDTDTFVLRSIDPIWDATVANFIARPAEVIDRRKWDQDVWENTFRSIGSSVVSMYNAGMLLFRHRAHKKVANAWEKRIWQYLDGELQPPWPDKRMPEQFALALSLAESGVSRFDLNGSHHAFGWTSESYSEATVMHTGSANYGHQRLLYQIGRDSQFQHCFRPAIATRLRTPRWKKWVLDQGMQARIALADFRKRHKRDGQTGLKRQQCE